MGDITNLFCRGIKEPFKVKGRKENPKTNLHKATFKIIATK
jgi:hypothetical protein